MPAWWRTRWAMRKPAPSKSARRSPAIPRVRRKPRSSRSSDCATKHKPNATRGRRTQVELRDGHHPDRPAARTDARPVRQYLARNARNGAEDGERSRQHAPGDAEAHGRTAGAHRASDGGHPQGMSEQLREIESIPRRCCPGRPLRLLPPAPAPDPFRQAAGSRARKPSRPSPAQFDSVRCPVSMPGGGRSARRTAISVRSRADLPVSSATPRMCRSRAMPERLGSLRRLRRKAAASSVSTRSLAPSTTGPRPTCGSASGRRAWRARPAYLQAEDRRLSMRSPPLRARG